MRRSVPLLSAALAAAPLAISQPDSSTTDLRFAAGSGSYASITRGCDNSVISKQRIDYDNVGAEVSHKFTSPLRIGVRGGSVRLEDFGPSDMGYVNPYVSLDWHGFSIGGGYVHGDHDFPEEDFNRTASGHVRIGKKVYWEVSWFEAVPLATAGYAQTGLGFHFPKADVWLGASVVPYDGAGLTTKGEYRFGNRLGLGGTLRLGSSEGVSENAFAVSLSYRFTHRGRSVEPALAPVPYESRSSPETAMPAAPPDSATAPAASDSVRSPRRGRSRAPRDRRSRRALC